MLRNPINNLKPYRSIILRNVLKKKTKKPALTFSKKKALYRKSLRITSWFVGKAI